MLFLFSTLHSHSADSSKDKYNRMNFYCLAFGIGKASLWDTSVLRHLAQFIRCAYIYRSEFGCRKLRGLKCQRMDGVSLLPLRIDLFLFGGRFVAHIKIQKVEFELDISRWFSVVSNVVRRSVRESWQAENIFSAIDISQVERKKTLRLLRAWI